MEQKCDKVMVLVPKGEYDQLCKEAGRRDVCWHCGGRLIWQSDFNYDEVYGEGDGIVTDLICNDCGAVVQYSNKFEEDEKDDQ